MPRTKSKKRFNWRKENRAMIFGDKEAGVYMKDILNVECLGDFGYHNFLTDHWSVCHLPSGLLILKFDSEREAKSFTKRLYLNVKTKWKPKTHCVISLMNFKQEVREFREEEVKRMGDLFYDTKEDIPF
jgi:hypothetical protein